MDSGRTILLFARDVLLAAILSVPAAGSTILYSDRSSWLIDAKVSTTIDFEGFAPAGGISDFSTPAGLTANDITFVGTWTQFDCSFPVGCTPGGNGNELFVSSAGTFDGLDWGSGAYLVGPANFFSVISIGNGTIQDGTVTVRLPSGITAWSFDLMSTGSLGLEEAVPHICLSSGECWDITTAPYPSRTFVGFTSSAALSSVTLTIPEGFPGSTRVYLDNFSVGAAVPEPGSAGLLVIGITSLLVAQPFRLKA
jgi:hypothetical protein